MRPIPAIVRVLVFLYQSDPEEPFLVQIFKHIATDQFDFVQTLVVDLTQNTFTQMRKSFAQVLHF